MAVAAVLVGERRWHESGWLGSALVAGIGPTLAHVIGGVAIVWQ